MTESISSNKHSMLVGENAKMLREQIEEEKCKIVSERVLSSDEETEISFSVRGNIRGLQATDIGNFLDTMRAGGALSGHGKVVLISEYSENTSYSESGISKVRDRSVSWPEAVYFHTTENIRRWH
jgi:hypothetical protein